VRPRRRTLRRIDWPGRREAAFRHRTSNKSRTQNSKAVGVVLVPTALPWALVPSSGKATGVRAGCGGKPTPLCPPHASEGTKVPAQLQKHTARAVGLKRHFCDGGNRPIRQPGSTPGGEWNWSYEREAQCWYWAIEVITRHALAAGSASALGDSVAVQHDPRTGVDIQSYCTSQWWQRLCSWCRVTKTHCQTEDCKEHKHSTHGFPPPFLSSEPLSEYRGLNTQIRQRVPFGKDQNLHKRCL